MIFWGRRPKYDPTRAGQFFGKRRAAAVAFDNPGSTLESLSMARQAVFGTGDGLRVRAQLATAVSQMTHVMGRVSVSRSPLKDLRCWVPASMSTAGFVPDSVSTLGRPWIWASQPGVLRSGPTCWQSFGIGQFVFGFEGQSLLLLFSAQCFLNLGIPLATAVDRIRRMSPEEVEGLFSAGAVGHVTLAANTVVWVPYGWVPMAMACPTRPGDSVAVAGFLPFFNEDMCHNAGQVMFSFVDSLEAFEVDADSQPELAARFNKDCGPVIEWLSTVLELGQDGQFSDGEQTPVISPRPANVGDAQPEGQSGPPAKRPRGVAASGSSGPYAHGLAVGEVVAVAAPRQEDPAGQVLRTSELPARDELS